MKKTAAFFLTIILVLSLGISAFAGGDGSGTGGGADNPFTLGSSSVPDGAVDVSADAAIVLTFTKNVVNMSCRDNNMRCFRLIDSAGNDVSVSVIMGDDQVDPDIKRIITVKPAALTPGETYTLIISPELQAKNGSSMGSEIRLTFTVAGEPEEALPPEETGEIPSESPSPEETGETPSESPTPEEPSVTPEPEKPAEASPAPEAQEPEKPAEETVTSETPAPEPSEPEKPAEEMASPEASVSETPEPEKPAEETAPPEASASETPVPEKPADETAAPEASVPQTGSDSAASAAEQSPAEVAAVATEEIPQAENTPQKQQEKAGVSPKIIIICAVITAVIITAAVLTKKTKENKK